MIGVITIEKKIKHLELIQDVIKRMANNSFMLKSWAVTLIAGIFVLADKDAESLYFGIAFIPVIAFWFLDAYYLLQEGLYRMLYERVLQTDEDKIDFSLKITALESESEKNCFWSCLISKTEAGFYGALLLVCTAIIVITYVV